MKSVELDDPIYNQALARAREAGFASVGDYIADRIRSDTEEAGFAHQFFTPDRLALIEKTFARLDAGGPSHDRQAVDASLKALQAQWQKDNQDQQS